jgi:hypothetical protein
VRTLLTCFLAAVVMVCGARFACGQAPLDQDRLAPLFAEYDDKKGGPEAERLPVLRKLAAEDEPQITKILLAELDRGKNGGFVLEVARLLGQRLRAGVLDDLRALLFADESSAQLRSVAATGIARQGHRGIDLLLDTLRAGDASSKIRDACLDGLAGQMTERVWRGLAPLSLQGTAPDRLRVLRMLEGGKGLPQVSQARLKLLDDQDLALVVVAWQQLAAEGHPKAKHKLDDVLERLGSDPPPALRADLLGALPDIGDADCWQRLLQLAATDAGPVQAALAKVAPRAAKDEALVQWLAARTLAIDAGPEREAAMRLLRAAPAAELVGFLLQVRARVREAPARNLDLAIGLAALLQKDPAWQQDAKALVAVPDPAARTAGLGLLLQFDSAAGVPAAQQSLDSKDWQLRSIAYRYLTEFRELASIPLLIARFDAESGRLAAELDQALFVHTGTRCWRRSEWEAWWAKHRDGFVLPARETVVSAKAGSGGGRTIAYFDIPLVSNKVAFLIDVSGSMNAPIGTDRKRTRLDEAKSQLRRVVEALPETHAFNVIVFEGAVHAEFERLRSADGEAKTATLGALKVLRPGGATNVHDALELAFRDAAVDTIYLLTDGDPTAGRIVDPGILGDEVRRWNLRRQVVIHCIAIGQESALLRRIANESGGIYKLVR